jgi:hypothetical protein
MPCPYANILGVPGEGFHEKRLYGVAFNDTIGTIGLASITTMVFDVDFKKSLLYWFVGAEVLHYAFGVDTAVLKMMGIKPYCQDKN